MSPPSEPRVWVRIPAEFPTVGEMVEFECEGLSLVLGNGQGEPYVFQARCPHGQASLAQGVLRGYLVECPLHGGKVDVRDGEPAAAPIRRGVRTYPTRWRGEGLEVGLPE